MKYIFPISILSSTIIGAGMFSLPFVFEEVGFLIGTAYLLFFTFVFWLTNTMYADIMFRTERLPGFVLYTKKYLGAWARIPATLVTVIGIIIGSTVYLVLAVSFIRLLFPGAPEALVVYSFWALGSLAIFLKIKRLAMLEFIILGAIVLLVAIIFISGALGGDYGTRNFSALPASLPLFFLPFGPVLFSLGGRSAIPSILEDVKESRLPDSNLSRIIFLGTAIPATLYLFFVLGIWGLSNIVLEDAVSGISRGSTLLLSALGIIGILSLFSTYIPIGVSAKKILETDFNFSNFVSGVIVVVSPILVYLVGLSFLELIAITGGIFLATESIFIVLVWNKLNILGMPSLLLPSFKAKTAYAIIVVFLAGMTYEVINIVHGYF